ncbi:hypothetical protein [Peribacillus frigoritolerans]|uniref:hypothetical protein n=1 Tax=Peribacillus frigoritolerans TaxID=450367 RepID=UPI0010599CF0|nr:hypothetical protein [Peribacillus frigoritolerans]TDL82844.1 hypothetical protein E2R53_04615 [Peribacillus frigoritolerans]
MRKMILLMTSISIFLVSCSSTKSFEGRISDIKKGYFEVDCSKEVLKDEKNAESAGYPCTVKLTDQTIFTDNHGKKLKARHFTTGLDIKVVLADRKKISKSKESRSVDASEIVLLN